MPVVEEEDYGCESENVIENVNGDGDGDDYYDDVNNQR